MEPTLQSQAIRPASSSAPAKHEYELIFRPDNKMYDGRWANNAWLQELPDPITHLTWDNAALLSFTDARKLGVTAGDMLKLTAGQRELTVPALPVPGQVEGVIVLPLGYGRTVSGNVGTKVGFNTYQLRTSDAMRVTPVKPVATGEFYELAITTHHDMIDATGEWGVKERVGDGNKLGTIAKTASLEEYRKRPHFVRENGEGGMSLQLFAPTVDEEWPEPAYPGARKSSTSRTPGAWRST